MKYNILLLIMLSLSNLNAQESNKKSTDTIQKLDLVFINTKVIFGSKYVAQNRSGSAYYVSAEELEKFSYTDINRVLRTVPGCLFMKKMALDFDQILVCVVRHRKKCKNFNYGRWRIDCSSSI